MPFKCCVPLCRGNYEVNGTKVSIFRFPEDDSLKSMWLNAIPRKDFVPTKHSRVCEKHFAPEDVEHVTECYDSKTGKRISVKLPQPRLRTNAVPKLFPSCPAYYSNHSSHRESRDEKRKRMENDQLSAAITVSLEEQATYKKRFCFCTLESLVTCLENVDIPVSWEIIQKEDCVLLMNLQMKPFPTVLSAVVIEKTLIATVFHKECEIHQLEMFNFPLKLSDVNDLCEVITKIENLKQDESKNSEKKLCSVICDMLSTLEKVVTDEKKNIIKCLTEQVSLIPLSKNNLKYSGSFLILCCLMYSVSPHAYRFLRSSKFLILPHPATLVKLCGMYNINPKIELNEQNFLCYAKEKFQFLNSNDKHIVLQMDEIHIKAFMDYKGGNILGAAYNCDKAANSAYVFMAQSIRSVYKDVVHIVPVRAISANFLHKVLLKVITGLENIGFSVVAVSSDNNAVNRCAISRFCNPPNLSIVYQHPSDPTRPLFFIIDAVHILKCIRNNWLNQKNAENCMFYPAFTSNVEENKPLMKSASLSALEKLHEFEMQEIVKLAPSLTEKALFPTNLERQNVRLVLQIFNSQLVEALKIAEQKYQIHQATDTAEYINVICKWFDIMNVKTIFKGKCKRNIYQEPLTHFASDEKLIFLNKFIDWLETWEKACCTTGCFTKETFLSLKHTSHAILEICRYCTDELKFNYILPGKFQTDYLEDRFGQYRQLAGSQYNISITQVYETETKLRIRSLLPLTLNSDSHGKVVVGPCDKIHDLPDFIMKQESIINKISVSESDICEVESLLMPLTYVAGYCAHAAVKRLKCSHCALNLLLDKMMVHDASYDLITSLDRGGLKYPTIDVVKITINCYIVVRKLLTKEFEAQFLQMPNQYSCACGIILNVLEGIDIPDICESGHSFEHVVKFVISAAVNIFLSNYCKKVNDCLVKDKNAGKKRKLMTLTS